MAQHRGFTLIELIISTGVIVLMLAVTLPAFSNFQKEQDVVTAAQLIRDAVYEGQNYALAPRGVEAGSEKNPGADYYRVLFYEDQSARIDIQEQTNAELTDFNKMQWQTVKTILLSSFVHYCVPQTVRTFYSNPASNPSAGITYSISQQGRIINPTGGIINIGVSRKGTTLEPLTQVQVESGRIDILVSDTIDSCQ